MICKNCGNNLENDVKFCPKCGIATDNNIQINQNLNNYNQNTINNYNNSTKLGSFTKTQKIIIISLLVILLVAVIILFSSKNSNKTRTIMIYLDGSDLESESKIVTSELKSINPSQINLKTTNLLIYTGGTEKWHNFISNEENAIYILKSNGFEKVKTYDKKNMGDPNTLTEFLKYSYDNYKASEYNLIFWDHGGAVGGAIYDDFSGDNLNLGDMNTALKNSPFNGKNKLQTINFRTCLNGTVEIASLFSKYADYLVASEEITRGRNDSDVLSFINKVNSNDNGITFGRKFIDRYYEQMAEIDPFKTTDNTYSIVDLSKIDKVTDELNTYFASIDINKYYNSISKNRSAMYQYGLESKSYDMVDLYELVKLTKDYASVDNTKLLNAIDNAIIYNNSNMNDSHGLSIYFPYNSSYFLRDYGGYSKFTEYNKFITTFNNIQSGNTSSTFSFSKEQTKTDVKDKISFQLTEEQYKNFSHANYYIFKRDPEHPNYFFYIYLSNNSEISDNGLLSASLKNEFIMMNNGTRYEYIPVVNVKNGNKESLSVSGILYDSDLELGDPLYMTTVKLIIKEEKNKLFFGSGTIISKNDRINGSMVNLKDYEVVDIFRTRRRLLDNDGNFIKNSEDWEPSPEIVGVEAKMDGEDVQLKKAGLEQEGEYYCVFEVFDVNNNSALSDLIRIGG